MASITVRIPDYSPGKGFEFIWEDGAIIETKIEDKIVEIRANKEGLISLANHFLNLAQDSIPSGYHFHLDEFNSLEEGSNELIIEKK